MFPDITTMLQSTVDQVRPMAQAATDTLSMWGYRIVERLDAIVDAVQEDSTVFARIRPEVTVASDGRAEADVVPAGEQWVLENVTLMPTGAVATPGSVLIGPSGLLTAWGGAHTGRPTTVGGQDVRFESGQPVIVSAQEVGCRVTMQFRCERVTARMHRAPTGMPVKPDPAAAPPNPELGRHVGTWSTN